jgi:hypothetical protein
MADFFIHRNLPKNEKIVSIIPGKIFVSLIFSDVTCMVVSRSVN